MQRDDASLRDATERARRYLATQVHDTSFYPDIHSKIDQIIQLLVCLRNDDIAAACVLAHTVSLEVLIKHISAMDIFVPQTLPLFEILWARDESECFMREKPVRLIEHMMLQSCYWANMTMLNQQLNWYKVNAHYIGCEGERNRSLLGRFVVRLLEGLSIKNLGYGQPHNENDSRDDATFLQDMSACVDAALPEILRRNSCLVLSRTSQRDLKSIFRDENACDALFAACEVVDEWSPETHHLRPRDFSFDAAGAIDPPASRPSIASRAGIVTTLALARHSRSCEVDADEGLAAALVATPPISVRATTELARLPRELLYLTLLFAGSKSVASYQLGKDAKPSLQVVRVKS